MPTPGSIQSSEHTSFLSLYFHVPFCSKKCPYCHFYVVPGKKEAHSAFIKTLMQEWDQKLPLFHDRTIISLYFGGGTPSQLDPLLIEQLLQHILKSPVTFHPALEITWEANPEDLSYHYLKNLNTLPINRLSMGVQSLHDPSLKILDRQHDSLKALEAVHTAASLGFDNISIDLMYDLPHQTLCSWNTTLTMLKALPISHLSLYNLTIEPHTLFYKKRKILQPVIPNDTQSLALLDHAVHCLEEIGLQRYEISAFAKPGKHSRHNTGYWMGREFLGLGPSAFSYFRKKRFRNCCDLRKYTQCIQQGQNSVDFEEELEPQASLRERLVIALRLCEGVDLTHLEPLPQRLQEEIICLEHEGFLEQSRTRLFLTPKGALFYDTVAAELI